MRISSVKAARFFLIPGILLLLTPALGRAGETSKADKPPVVMVCMVGNDEPSQVREQRFVVDLKLAMDGFEIKQIETGMKDFTTLTLPEQLGRIRPFVDEFDAVATVWLEPAGSDAVLLHLVALSTGRALVRIVAARSGPDTEKELALAAEELLGEVYLFSPRHPNEAVTRVVTQVKNEVIAIEPETEGLRVGAMPLFQLGSGIYGQKGPSLLVGGGLGMEIWPWNGLFLQPRLSFLAGPRGQPHDGLVSGLRLAPGLLAGYDFRVDRFLVGPFIGLEAIYSLADMALGRGDVHTYSWWNFRGSAGLDLRWRATDRFFIGIQPAIGAYPIRKHFTRLSDKSNILVTPFLDWSMALMVVVFL